MHGLDGKFFLDVHLAGAVKASSRAITGGRAVGTGLAMGGGCEIALACDLRVAAEDARFALPEVKLGVLSGSGGLYRLPELIGPARALELMERGSEGDSDASVSIRGVGRNQRRPGSLHGGTVQDCPPHDGRVQLRWCPRRVRGQPD